MRGMPIQRIQKYQGMVRERMAYRRIIHPWHDPRPSATYTWAHRASFQRPKRFQRSLFPVSGVTNTHQGQVQRQDERFPRNTITLVNMENRLLPQAKSLTP